MSRQEAAAQYNKALKAGQRCYNDCIHHGWYPYPQALDEILGETMPAGSVELGLVDVPLDLIAGTRTAGRQAAFAANFMPLLPPDSEFAAKWVNLCSAHLGDAGIRDPIKCYEYLGRFYIQEGNKRVSVLKSFDAVTIPGLVTRVVPAWSEDGVVQIYYEFMHFYDLSRVYRIHFRRPGGYARLQAALGFDDGHVWTEDERSRFLAVYTRFRQTYKKLNAGRLPVTTAEALLVCSQVYSLEELGDMSGAELEKSLKAVWADVEAEAKGAPIEVNTVPEESSKKGGIGRILGNVRRPSHLNVAFVYSRAPEESTWLLSHDRGRQYMEETLGQSVTVRTYTPQGDEGAEDAMERAAAEGAGVIFAPTPQLINACRKTAANYPGVRVLNCSVALPYKGVRTYHSRMYEGTFVAGAVAGAMTAGDRIGYITENPLYGVPAAINAFALGAQLTNPRARVLLKWTCLPGDPVGELIREGVEVVFCREKSTTALPRDGRGLYRLGKDRELSPLARLDWNWGNFYLRLVRSILGGGWEELGDREGAVNYWWGLGSGTIDVVLGSALPVGVSAMASILCTGLVQGSLYVFHRPIRDNSGTVRNDGNQWFNPEKILYMDWLSEFVDGFIPSWEQLEEKARSVVRLQGVYRDRIPPEKEGAAK